MPIAPSLAVAAHLEFCSVCRAAVRGLEEADGVLLCAAPAEPMSPGALTKALQRIEDVVPDPLARRRRPTRPGELPLVIAAAGVGPRSFLGPGRWFAPVVDARTLDWRLFLVRVPAGAIECGLAEAHRGFVFIVKGECRRAAATYRSGDFVEPSGESAPLLVADPGRPLLALVATHRPQMNVE